MWEKLEVKLKDGNKIEFVNLNLISPSCQGGPTIFHKGYFLKLKGVVFPHPPLT